METEYVVLAFVDVQALELMPEHLTQLIKLAMLMSDVVDGDCPKLELMRILLSNVLEVNVVKDLVVDCISGVFVESY